jgi:hypothetical protein
MRKQKEAEKGSALLRSSSLSTLSLRSLRSLAWHLCTTVYRTVQCSSMHRRQQARVFYRSQWFGAHGVKTQVNLISGEARHGSFPFLFFFPSLHASFLFSFHSFTSRNGSTSRRSTRCYAAFGVFRLGGKVVQATAVPFSFFFFFLKKNFPFVGWGSLFGGVSALRERRRPEPALCVWIDSFMSLRCWMPSYVLLRVKSESALRAGFCRCDASLLGGSVGPVHVVIFGRSSMLNVNVLRWARWRDGEIEWLSGQQQKPGAKPGKGKSLA